MYSDLRKIYLYSIPFCSPFTCVILSDFEAYSSLLRYLPVDSCTLTWKLMKNNNSVGYLHCNGFSEYSRNSKVQGEH
jgi:hypothetical protein